MSPSERARLDAKLTAHQRDSGQQMALLIIPTLNGEVLEDVAVRTFEAWQLGKKGKDDGLLMLVVSQDRKIKIEVGDGLEGEVTDALAGRIIRHIIVPAFRNNDYLAGLDGAFDALMTAAAGKAPALPDDAHDHAAQNRRYAPPLWMVWVGIWLFFVFMRAMSRRGLGGVGWFVAGSILNDIFSSRGGGWGSGGGGGFSGGGGGRSSGGGASGSW